MEQGGWGIQRPKAACTKAGTYLILPPPLVIGRQRVAVGWQLAKGVKQGQG